MEINIKCIKEWTSNHNVMQHHANNVRPVLMNTHYSYTEHS